MAKNGPYLCIFYSKLEIWKTFIRKHLLPFFRLLIIDFPKNYYENFSNFERGELVKNLPQVYVPNQFLHTISSFSLRVKMKMFEF